MTITTVAHRIAARSTNPLRAFGRILATLVVAGAIVAGLAGPAHAYQMPVEPGAGGAAAVDGDATSTVLGLSSGVAAVLAVIAAAAVVIGVLTVAVRASSHRRDARTATVGI
jgi:hypothetical protein